MKDVVRGIWIGFIGVIIAIMAYSYVMDRPFFFQKWYEGENGKIYMSMKTMRTRTTTNMVAKGFSYCGNDLHYQW